MKTHKSAVITVNAKLINTWTLLIDRRVFFICVRNTCKVCTKT